jgi:hypothetical protein
MALPPSQSELQAPLRLPEPSYFLRRLEEIDMFFRKNDRVHQTMRRVCERLSKVGVDYAVIGGMAVNAHRHERTTKDVDLLLTAAGLAVLRGLASSGEFEAVPGRPRRFIDPATRVTFDVLIAGHFPGSGVPGPLAFPDPADVAQTIDDFRVIDLPTLIQLKLAARRYQDFADVVSLIRANGLDESFQDQLHASVRADFVECVAEKRREDEYEARQDRAAEAGNESPAPDDPP